MVDVATRKAPVLSEPLRLLALAFGAGLIAASLWVALVSMRRARGTARLWAGEDSDAAAPPAAGAAVDRWLSLAGLRGPHARRRLMTSLAASGLAAATIAAVGPRLPGLAATIDWAGALPALGPALAPLLSGLPWGAALGVLVAPVLAVRAQRQRRIEAVEVDLPLVLELLATLSETGLGFDAALARILDAQDDSRPLTGELRALQRDARAGVRRSDCLRRFASRLEIPVVTSVVSALVQAEESGAGVAGVLRPLADDLRAQRRERELARVEALPNKLVLALVVGFLPGLLLWTLGPSFHQLFEIINSITGG